MKVKRIIAVLFAVIIAIAAVPVQVRAEEVYTVVLKAGTGSGDDIVYHSDEGTIADSWKSAANCQFYRENDGRMGFKLDLNYCPDSFSAPEGYEFDGWDLSGVFTLSSQATTCTAKWWEDTVTRETINGIPKTSSGEDFYLNGMKWHVIGEDENRWLAISSDLLEVEDSLTMSWVGAMSYCFNFYDGFSDCEKASLLKVTKKDEYYEYGDLKCDGIFYDESSLNAKGVFLLSIPEANWYFADDAARVCNKLYGWWLRSRLYENNNIALTVESSGGLNYRDIYDENYFGFRPAFVLDRSSVLFTSAAEGGKPSATVGTGFGIFKDGGIGAKKLTLLDSTRSGFSADVEGGSSTMAVPGGSVEIKYSGAGTGLNEYVSAMLCDSKDSVIGYASVLSGSDGEGTWSLTLPSNLKDGEVYKLKVFSEQQNGNHLTDYASTPVEIGLTVGSIPGWSPEPPVETVETVEIHRLYNPNSGEHFYTGNVAEKDFLVEVGWNYEGVAWNAPDFSLNPVYRFYDKNSGAHRYTMDEEKRDGFIAEGWSDEGIGWYSDGNETIPVFGLYNKNALQAGAYHFTADTSERDFLIELGWTDEGIGWYGI